MFALGCIQALQCTRNTCPTGVTTHNPRLQRGLVPAEKSQRVAHFHNNLVKEVETIPFDFVITVCGHADENCPVFTCATTVVHYGFDDPPKLAQNAKTEEETLDHYRRVRDEIRAFVETLPGILR